MVWGIMFPSGIISVIRTNGRVTAKKQKSAPSSFALVANFDLMEDYFILQQGNCSVHVARSILDFFEGKGIALLDWPGWSPDLNVMENVRSLLAIRTDYDR